VYVPGLGFFPDATEEIDIPVLLDPATRLVLSDGVSEPSPEDEIESIRLLSFSRVALDPDKRVITLFNENVPDCRVKRLSGTIDNKYWHGVKEALKYICSTSDIRLDYED
jgi:hypothetical protein